MRITKWVDMGAEVEVDISVEDIRRALSDYFAEVTRDPLGERQNGNDIKIALNQIAAFLRALTDEQIAMLSAAQCAMIHKFLSEQSERFNREIIPENDKACSPQTSPDGQSSAGPSKGEGL